MGGLVLEAVENVSCALANSRRPSSGMVRTCFRLEWYSMPALCDSFSRSSSRRLLMSAASFWIELFDTLDVHWRGSSEFRIFAAAHPDALPLGGEQWPALRIGSPAHVRAIDHDRFVIELLRGPEFRSPITARQVIHHFREVLRSKVDMTAARDQLAERFLSNEKEIKLTLDPSSHREISVAQMLTRRQRPRKRRGSLPGHTGTGRGSRTSASVVRRGVGARASARGHVLQHG